MTSPLSSTVVAEGSEIGSTTVFISEVAGELVSFRPGEAGTFVDDGTGSTWNFTGEAIAGPAPGDRLIPLPRVDTFWFSWATFHPDTALHAP